MNSSRNQNLVKAERIRATNPVYRNEVEGRRQAKKRKDERRRRHETRVAKWWS